MNNLIKALSIFLLLSLPTLANIPGSVLQSAENVGSSVVNSGKKARLKVSDASITAQIKTALIADPVVRASRVDVDTRRGVVYLKGEVQSRDAMNRVVNVATSVEGVEQVINNLSVISEN